MQKFFGFWLGLMMLIYTVFTPIYLFSNSSTDEVEEITFEKLLVSLSYRGISQSELDKKVKILETLNIEADEGIVDALEDIDGVNNISVKIIGSRNIRVDSRDLVDRSLDNIRLSFTDKESRVYNLDFIVIDKSYFLPGFSEMLGLKSVNDSILGDYNNTMKWQLFENIFKEEGSL